MSRPRALRALSRAALCSAGLTAAVACGPLSAPLPRRLDPDRQNDVDEAWNRALSPVTRYDRGTWLDVLIVRQPYQVGVDTFEFKSEKRFSGGVIVMESRFDRSKPEADVFRVTIKDGQGAILRQESYTREEIEQASEELAKDRRSPGGRWQTIDEVFPKELLSDVRAQKPPDPAPCAGAPANPASPAASAAASASAPPPQALSPGATPLLKELADLHHFLEQGGLTVKAVADRVGPITADPGVPMAMTLKPRAAWIQRAKLSRYRESGAVYTLALDFTPDARPTIQELRTIFGEDRPAVPSLHGERTTLFYPSTKGKPSIVAVIADLSRCFDPHSPADPPPGPCEKLHAGSRVEKLTFRRDSDP